MWPVWADGTLHPPGTPVVRADDQGFALGLAVFETLLLEERCLYFVEEHLARMEEGASAVGIAWPPPWDPRAALLALARAIDWRDAALRLTLTRGVPGGAPAVVVTARAITRYPAAGARLFVSSYRRRPSDPLARVKSTDRLTYVLAREEATERGAHEALVCDEDGLVCEGTISNLFAVFGDALRTPPIETGCLGGIMRARILEEVARDGGADGGPRVARAEDIALAELAEADELFLSNTTGRAIPVAELLDPDGAARAFPGSAGAATRAVRRLIDAREARYRRAAGVEGAGSPN